MEARIARLIALLDNDRTNTRAQAARDLRYIAWDENQPKPVVDAGAIPKLIKLLPATETRAGKKIPAEDAISAALCLRSISAYEFSFRKSIVSGGALPLLVNLLKAAECPSGQEHAALTLANICRHDEFRPRVAEAGALGPLLAMLTRDHEDGSRIRALHCLYTLVLDPDVRDVVAKEENLEKFAKLQPYLANFDSFSLSMVLANVISVEDKERMVHVGPTMISNFQEGLSEVLNGEKNFFDLQGVSNSIQRLAANNDNKEIIGSSQVLPLLIRALLSTNYASPEDKSAVAGALWALAFLDSNKTRILGYADGVKALRDIAADRLHPGRDNAIGCLWELDRLNASKVDNTAVVGLNGKSVPPLGHVMLSYNWKHQALVLRVKDALERAGYTVWIDVEQMSGNTLEAMAKAVEDAAVVIVCASRLYLESPNCRSEANYAFAQRKDIVPLVVEKDFTPQGWLGLLIGTKLYYDFSNADFEGRMQALIRELGHRGIAIAAERAVQEHKLQHPTQIVSSSFIADWNQDKVAQWLKETAGFDDGACQRFNINGLALMELNSLAQSAPGFLYEKVLPQLGLTSLPSQLEFVARLRKLI